MAVCEPDPQAERRATHPALMCTCMGSHIVMEDTELDTTRRASDQSSLGSCIGRTRSTSMSYAEAERFQGPIEGSRVLDLLPFFLPKK